MPKLVQVNVVFSTFADGEFKNSRYVAINPFEVSSIEWHNRMAKLIAIRMKNGDSFVITVNTMKFNHVLTKLALPGKKINRDVQEEYKS